MKQALKYEPGHQIGTLNLGIVNLAAGNLEKSKEWLEKAVAIIRILMQEKEQKNY